METLIEKHSGFDITMMILALSLCLHVFLRGIDMIIHTILHGEKTETPDEKDDGVWESSTTTFYKPAETESGHNPDKSGHDQ